jgi:hypothetical protein
MIWPRQALSGHNLLCSETRRVILQLLPVSRFGLAALEQDEQERVRAALRRSGG